MYNTYLKLMKSINSTPHESRELYDLAVKNKISLLYLESLKKRNRLDKLKKEYNFEINNYHNFLNALENISEILNGWVDYFIFKSIKPYPSVPGDIDIMILGSDEDYLSAVEYLIKSGYEHQLEDDIDIQPLIEKKMYKKAAEVLTKPTFGKGDSLEHISPTGTDFIDSQSNFGIDLQKDLALSYIVYMDKNKFKDKVRKIKIRDSEVYVPYPALDLALTIAHSVAEQMYLLGEFYTAICYLNNMKKREMNELIEILKENRILNAARSFFGITKGLHEKIYGTNKNLDYIVESIGYDNSEFKRLENNEFKLPHKYRCSVFLSFLMEKFLEKRFRHSLCTQIFKTFTNPRLMKLIIKQLIEIRRRDSYLKRGI